MGNRIKKIGILTFYYKSDNYGGNLQAYALPRFINNMGFSASQISYSAWATLPPKKRKPLLSIFQHPIQSSFSFALRIRRRFLNMLHYSQIRSLQRETDLRQEAFNSFQINRIPHTAPIVDKAELFGLNNEFDCFITGSDQVFNLVFSSEEYFLTFVSSGKKKFSYAASMALSEIPDGKKTFVREALKGFSGVSVREEKTVDLLSEVLEKKIELSVDPTLLLNTEEWDLIASSRIVAEDYIFCYFLGPNPVERQMAKQLAAKEGCLLTCIPFVQTKYTFVDSNFGDVQLPHASPEDFVSLIKHAKYVITDSFHACVFSLIYHKQFVVFNRDDKGTMNSRIESLTRLFHVEERFAPQSSTIESVAEVLKMSTVFKSEEFEKMTQASVDYLKRNLS